MSRLHSMTDFYPVQDSRPWRARNLSEAESYQDPSIRSLISATRRELAIFASDTLGAQSHVGQFAGHGGKVGRTDRLFRDMIENTDRLFLVIDPRPGLHIIEANVPYASATLVDPSRVCGEKLFDVFPDDPADPTADGVCNLFRSLQNAAQSGAPDTMNIQRYAVRDASGAFIERFWRPTNTPIYDEAGRLLYLVHHVTDATAEMGERI